MVAQELNPRVYVACLASYNAGKLHGKWIDCNDRDSMQNSITGMLAASPEHEAEEWAIHDYEGFGSLSLSEYQSLETVAAMAGFIQEHGPLASEVLSHFGGDLDEARQALEEQYAGCYDSLEDFAASLTEETGRLEQVPEHIRGYIDYEAMAHDMELNGDIFTLEPHYQQVHVFWNR
jgi:antirestriction protein